MTICWSEICSPIHIIPIIIAFGQKEGGYIPSKAKFGKVWETLVNYLLKKSLVDIKAIFIINIFYVWTFGFSSLNKIYLSKINGAGKEGQKKEFDLKIRAWT